MSSAQITPQALVTGAGSGIGQAICLRLAQEGRSVVAADIDLAAAQATARHDPSRITAHALDVGDDAGWQRTMDSFAQLDTLVNSAGYGVMGSFLDLALVDWERMIAVNLTGTMLGCRHLIRRLIQRGAPGVIVNISSVGGLTGSEGIEGYCATKGGVTLLTKAVSLSAARAGIRVVAVAPSYVDSPMLKPAETLMGGRARMVETLSGEIPLGRLIRTDEVAAAVSFLVSPAAAMISGTTLTIDGGYTAGRAAPAPRSSTPNAQVTP